MAVAKEIKSRIKSTKNTGKITKAMELISTVKMKKAQDRVRGARPFAEESFRILSKVTSSISSSPLANTPKGSAKSLYVVFSSNKGLCGGHNVNVFRKIIGNFKDNNSEFISIGNKARDFIRYSEDANLKADFSELMNDDFLVKDIRKLSRFLIKEFESGSYKEIILCYNYYESAVSQKVITNQLFPLSEEKINSYLSSVSGLDVNTSSSINYKIEPDEETIVSQVLPLILDLMIYEIFLESKASEHASRMVAMKNAKDSASKKVDALTMQYNKARQAAVTQEVSEIVSGVESMK